VNAAEHIIGVSGPDLGNLRAGLAASATSASFAVVSGGMLCALHVAALAAANASRVDTTTVNRCPRTRNDLPRFG